LPQLSDVDATAVLLLNLQSCVDESGHMAEPAGQKGIKTRAHSANRPAVSRNEGWHSEFYA
jgi:hypothetical protein